MTTSKREPSIYDEFPTAFAAALRNLTLRLEREEISLQEARSIAEDMVKADGEAWDIFFTLHATNHDGHPLLLVALGLINSALATLRNAPARVRALVAADLARALLMTDKRGLAEAELARATDLMEQVSLDEPGATGVSGMIRSVQIDLLRSQKRYDEARALNPEPAPPAPGSIA